MFGVAKRGQNSIEKYLCKKHKISILHRVNSPIHSHPPSLRTEPVFVNVYGALESILRNQFCQPM
jgi:hypothetical protein